MAMLGKLKDVFAVVQSFATVCALIVGGVWGAYLFQRERQHFENALLSYKVAHHPLEQDKTFLHVTVEIKNLGKTLLGISTAQTWVEQIDPVPSCVVEGVMLEQRIDQAIRSHEMTSDTLPWCLIKNRTIEWKEGEFQIEPGESDEVYFDLIIPAAVKVVKLYVKVVHAGVSKGARGLVWQRELVYKVQPK
jgi:hypothetical protein